MKLICEIDEHGNEFWKLPSGDYHRENDLPAIERVNGTKEWWLNGKLHRDNDLPAYEHVGGDKAWYVNGECHRTNGPAVEYADGDKYWWLEGIRYTEEKYNEKVKKYKTEDKENINSYSQEYLNGTSKQKWL